jgi:TPP-dependent 2-oxoacid decarboxylase
VLETRPAIEEAPALILAGVQFTDLNSGLFSQKITRSRTIELGAHAASVGSATFAPVELPTALAALVPLVSGDATFPSAEPRERQEGRLSQATLWAEVAGALCDVVLADQGTSFYGMAPHRLPAAVSFVGQPLWASIGYTLPALLGTCTATGRRGVLLIGDGAAQITVQELGTVIRLGLTAVVVVVDNDGYTVERAIHGPDEAYNDIIRWDWTALPAFVRRRPRGACGHGGGAARGTTDADGVTLIQAVVPKGDVPPLLDTLTRASASRGRTAPRPA